MIVFSVVGKFENRYFCRLNLFMRYNEWSGLFYVEGFGEGTEYIHLHDVVIITKVALKVTIFNTISEIKKKRCCVFGVDELKLMMGLS